MESAASKDSQICRGLKLSHDVNISIMKGFDNQKDFKLSQFLNKYNDNKYTSI